MRQGEGGNHKAPAMVGTRTGKTAHSPKSTKVILAFVIFGKREGREGDGGRQQMRGDDNNENQTSRISGV